MNDIFKQLNNRELSLLIWLLILVAFVFIHKGVRGAAIGVVKQAFIPMFLIMYSLLIGYTIGLLYVLKLIGLWDFTLLKDVVFWFFGVALVMMFASNKANEPGHFKRILKSTIAWTVVVELVINFKTLPIWVELLMVPILALVGGMLAVSKQDTKHAQVHSCLTKGMSLFGYVMLATGIYYVATNFNEFWTLATLRTFLLPIVLTVFVLPFMYLLALYMMYETLFVRISFMVSNDERLVKETKKLITKTAGGNLEKLNRISKNISKNDLRLEPNLQQYIHKISMKEIV